jgi:hypothetical protein
VRAAAFRGWHSADAGAHAVGSAAEKSPPQHSHPGPLATPLIHPVSIDLMRGSCIRSDWPVGPCRCRHDGEGHGRVRDRSAGEHDHRAVLGSRLGVTAGADTSSDEGDGRDPSWGVCPGDACQGAEMETAPEGEGAGEGAAKQTLHGRHGKK